MNLGTCSWQFESGKQLPSFFPLLFKACFSMFGLFKYPYDYYPPIFDKPFRPSSPRGPYPIPHMPVPRTNEQATTRSEGLG